MISAFEQHYPDIADGVFIDDSATVIGQVSLAQGVSVWPQVVIRGDIQRISIGANTNIQDGSILHVTHDSRFAPGGFALALEQNITVGHRAILHGCHIQRDCLVGMGAIVMDGVVVEPQVMIAAGSVVPPGKRLESGYLWLGNPARAVRKLHDEELAFIAYSAEHYVKLAKRHQGVS